MHLSEVVERLPEEIVRLIPWATITSITCADLQTAFSIE
jgi:hypothetical protein